MGELIMAMNAASPLCVALLVTLGRVSACLRKGGNADALQGQVERKSKGAR